MKIDLVIDSLRGGGAERVLVNLANYFDNKKEIVRIITFNEGKSYQFSVNQVLLTNGKISNHTIRSFINLLVFYFKKNNRPDLIISFLPRTNLISILIGKFYRIPVIVCEHINHLAKVGTLDKFTQKKLYRYASQLTVLTEYDVKYFEKYKAKVTVMQNPCTFTTPKNNTNRKKNILAVGSLDRYHHKGFDNLIKICTPILKKYPEWTLEIAGSGVDGYEVLNQMVIARKLKSQIKFLGFREDINTLMQGSSIFILPSRFEGLPMVLLEALSQGMSCIAYDCKTGPSDMINHMHNGLLIENQNINLMQTELEELLTNESLRNKLSQNAIKSVEKFSINEIGNKWYKLFEKISLKC